MKHAILFALTALLLASPAFAGAPASTLEPNVKIFKDQLEAALENQQAQSKANGCNLLVKGDITVEKAAGYYAFTLPALVYINPTGSVTQIGMIAVNAVPDADGVNWKVSVAIPTPIKRYNGAQEIVRTELGAQNISGVWNTKVARFTTVNATLKNVVQNFLAEKSIVTIETLTATEKLTETTPGSWAGPLNIVASNVSAGNDVMKYKAVWPKIAMNANVVNLAGNAPMAKEDILKRPQTSYGDYYNILSLVAGEPKVIHSSVTGMDKVAAELQQGMLTAKQESRSMFMGSNIFVAALNALGKKDATDPNVKNYDTVFNNGTVTINDVDIASALKLPQ